MGPQAIARRATLQKAGSPDVRVQVSRIEGGGFSLSENGKGSVTWPKYSAEQLKRGDTPPMTMDEAWRSLLSKYPGYTETNREESFPDDRDEKVS
jgi:hypothetical protein